MERALHCCFVKRSLIVSRYKMSPKIGLTGLCLKKIKKKVSRSTSRKKYQVLIKK